MNSDQKVSIIASQDDGLYYNHITKEFCDLDILYEIRSISEIIHDPDDNYFYLLVNKYKEKLGLFLIRLDEHNPYEFIFFLKYQNKLDIGDADICIIKNKDKGYKELLVSYKTIYMNTYTVHVIDIATES